MAFEFWQKFKNELNKDHNIDLRMLSPQHSANIIPYMVSRIDNILLAKVIAQMKNYLIFSGNEGFVGNNFVVLNQCAYFVNPLNQQNIQVAYERTNLSKAPKFTQVGIITANHAIFKNKKQESIKIDDDHSSLKFFKKLMMIAVNQGASDLHITPRNKTHIYFRFRIDGILIDNLVDDIEIFSYKLLANQIISHAKGEAGNYVTILTGKFNLLNKDIDASIRVSMMPTEYQFERKETCPRFVARVHNNNTDNIKELSSIGLNSYLLKEIRNLTNLNQGLIVVTGPTGSGKTTLLYALLNEINNTQRGRSIQTLEDPIEQNLPNIDQCSMNPDAGIDYSSCLKAFLRQDIDVALIGEIRDEKTAEKVTEIAMTGHLALSTLHTNTALGTVNRLRRLGIDDRDTADTLKTVIATRLVRKVCPYCAKKTNKNDDYFVRYKALFEKINIAKCNLLLAGDGCEICKFRAYRGRVLVAEIFNLNATAQSMIVANKPIIEIEQYLVSQGGQTIWHHATELLLQGQTTVQELEHVLSPFSGCI